MSEQNTSEATATQSPVVDENTGTITAQDIALMRRADDVCAHHSDGCNYLAAIKRADHSDPFASDKRVEIAVTGDGVDGNFSYRPELQGLIFGFLRAGDVVRLEWYRNAGTNDYLREANLACDLLYLHVIRGRKSYRFLVDESCNQADSRYRMCGETAKTYSLA